MIWSMIGREASVKITIKAEPTTIVFLDGEIKQGGKIALKSHQDENRVFKLNVLEFAPEKKLVWGDNKGRRTFTLNQLTPSSLV